MRLYKKSPLTKREKRRFYKDVIIFVLVVATLIVLEILINRGASQFIHLIK